MAVPATGLLDTFNRANEGPPPSSSWTNLTGVQEDEGMVVLSNACAKATASANFRGAAYWNVADFGSDCEVFATYVNSVTAGAPQLYLRLVNIGTGTTDGYSLEVDFGASPDTWTIFRFDNGVGTPLGASATQNVALGEQILFRAAGSTLTGWHKPSAGTWTQILSRTDATYSAAGKIGASVLGSDQATRLDDFSGGTLGQVGSGIAGA